VRLLSIRLNNYRQFYGETPKISFSHGDMNVTVVHGENGAGKTTLLNAFTWTLFDSVTPGFESPTDIVNKRAIREAAIGKVVEAWVEIEFMHQELRHSIKRIAKATRKTDAPGWDNHEPQIPELWRIDQNGRGKRVDEVYEAIGRILPQDLHTYFFFDGERIERIVQPTAKQKEETGNAAKKLLGVEIFTRAEEHLIKAKRELEKELTKYGDAETAELLQEKQDKENERSAFIKRQKEISVNIEAHKKRCEDIEAKLRKDTESQAIQERRDQLKKDRDDRAESFKGGTKALSEIVSKQGYLLYSEEIINNFETLIEDLIKRGEIPSGIKKNFVEALLNNHKCICDGELLPGSDSWQAVENWKNKAGLADVEQKAIRMGGGNYSAKDAAPTCVQPLGSIAAKKIA
jgi:DNA sulfur modification protein DndD